MVVSGSEGFVQFEGQNFVRLRTVCPKSKIFNNGGTCSIDSYQWKFSNCAHEILINDEGYCTCGVSGCSTEPTIISKISFKCENREHWVD